MGRLVGESVSGASSGPGIAFEQQRLLFQRFEQLDSSTTRKDEGMGIGLPLIKKFNYLVSGTIHLESTLSKGATIKLLLPLESENH